VVTVDHPAAGEIKLVGPAVTYSLTPAEVRSAPPLLGEHTAVVLGTLQEDAPATPDAGAGGDSAS
jgi:crotonobetainyl-CoA:carnitine CoA-transferase CaiB-like acyl-CoA transferase